MVDGVGDLRAGVCLMTAGADRALGVTSGTELFAAGVPVVGRHQLDGHAKIGSRWGRAPQP